MRSKITKRILKRTPEDVNIYVKKYADLTVLIHDIMEEKGIKQKDLAIRMDKKPSEISKWLSGAHNFTIQTICKLEAVLGEVLLFVPKRKKFISSKRSMFSLTVMRPHVEEIDESKFKHGVVKPFSEPKIA